MENGICQAERNGCSAVLERVLKPIVEFNSKGAKRLVERNLELAAMGVAVGFEIGP